MHMEERRNARTLCAHVASDAMSSKNALHTLVGNRLLAGGSPM